MCLLGIVERLVVSLGNKTDPPWCDIVNLAFVKLGAISQTTTKAEI